MVQVSQWSDQSINPTNRFGGIKLVCKIRFYNLVPWALSGTVKAEVKCEYLEGQYSFRKLEPVFETPTTGSQSFVYTISASMMTEGQVGYFAWSAFINAVLNGVVLIGLSTAVLLLYLSHLHAPITGTDFTKALSDLALREDKVKDPETQSKTEAAVVEDDTADDHETRHSIELNQLQSARHRSIHKKDKAGDGIDLEAAPISPKRWESSSKRDAAPNRLDDQSLQEEVSMKNRDFFTSLDKNHIKSRSPKRSSRMPIESDRIVRIGSRYLVKATGQKYDSFEEARLHNTHDKMLAI